MPLFRYDNQQNVYYELYGREGDPCLTIVNGLSMRTTHWAPYFKLLPQLGIRVLSYDMLGQGQSSKPILGLDFEDHARVLKKLHDHLGIKNPYVLGISFGGVVVLKYAVMYPNGLRGLIPVSTFSELDPQLNGHATNLYLGLARVGFEFYLDLLMPLNFTNDWLEKNHEMISVIKRVGASSNELFGIQNLMESLRDFTSMTHELKHIKVPTLILNGEYDALTPRHLHDVIRREVKNSRMMIIQRMCHAFTLEIPELTSHILADFVRTVEAGRWRGDQSVWIANEDVGASEVAFPYPPGDHLRFIPMPQTPPALTPKAVPQPAAEAKPAPKTAAAKKAAPKPKAKAQPKPAKTVSKPAGGKPKALTKPAQPVKRAAAKPAPIKAPRKKAPAKA